MSGHGWTGLENFGFWILDFELGVGANPCGCPMDRRARNSGFWILDFELPHQIVNEK
jgi:hypothetical protein